MENVIDLDILRPDKTIIKLNGKEIDVSFIPLGITFEVDDIVNELGKFTKKELQTNRVKIKEALSITVRLCATFASYKYPEMDEKWFTDNCDSDQINRFATAIKGALERSYKGIETYGKN